ncbi:toll/interleukin-1 receptor domain-containing protein [Synechococcus sp. ATX 2A4]|uniref:toll/interleukin-1 receptor domain-containing protein n=1 Tax=Synechococcus sp. ATX 2A4 TaxID=2823727 RepID=UPI0020CD2D78|nr:toll/interleukin-1 receptor domain-containing protein [Synechococcus sp. ATX 2A4]MCP9883603.1 toll/interleukin-1 receptor domain-containing protein [Synechococcus sp. ATX 2A4]
MLPDSKDTPAAMIDNAGNDQVVFISYDRTNSPLAQQLQHDLMRAGLSAWLDKSDISSHDPDWQSSIAQAINSCSHFIVIATEESAASVAVAEEFELAIKLNRPIFILRTCALVYLPKTWQKRQILDFTFAEVSYQDAIGKLIIDLGSDPSLSPGLLHLLNAETLTVGRAASTLTNNSSFTLKGTTFRYLPFAPSAYSMSYLIAPEDADLCLPPSLAFFCKCTGRISRGDTIQEVVQHRLEERLPPWVLMLKGHVPKESESFRIPVTAPRIWNELVRSVVRLLEAPGIKGRPVDLYLECPAVLAFEIGCRLRGMAPFRCFQYEYGSTYFNVLCSDHGVWQPLHSSKA